MSLPDIMQQYLGGAPQPSDATPEHYDQVVAQASPDAVADGITHALRSDQTPPFPDMVAQMFGQSSPQVRANVLGQLLSSIGPAVLGSLATGGLGRVLGGLRANGGTAGTSITPEQAAQVSPADVQEVARRAEQHDPGIAERVGSVYAQHPQALKALGGIALAIALGRIANRNR